MIRLSHPRAEDGYADVRAAADRMFADRPNGIGCAELEAFGWFELLRQAPEVGTRAMFESQGAALAVAGTLDGFVLDTLRRLGADPSPMHTTGVLLSVAQRPDSLLAIVPEGFRASDYLFQSPTAPEEILRVPARLVDARPIDTVDRTMRLIEVSVVHRAEAVAAGRAGLIGNHAHIALGLQLLGMCDRLLELGRDHVLSRHQFGRPIGTFQAVQHLLADAAVAIAAAQCAADAAVHALFEEDSAELSSLLAAGAAARAFTRTSTAVQQVLGAIGYTREHEFTRFLRRGLLLTFLIGSASIDRKIGYLAAQLDTPLIPPSTSFTPSPSEDIHDTP